MPTNDLASPFLNAQAAAGVPGVEPPVEDVTPAQDPKYSDETLLERWEDTKKTSLNNRWMFERLWQRNIWYVLGRQWIEYLSKWGGWKDKRIADWIPRPVTNKCKETLQAIRAMFTSIQLGVNVRPNGTDAENVAAAGVADELVPVLHEAHEMNAILNEFDFWLIVTGNAFLHSFVDYDIKNGVISIQQEQCQGCGNVHGSDQLAGAAPVCPDCGATQFAPAVDPKTSEPVPPVQKMRGKPTTVVLSPLELAFSNDYPRFSEVPRVVRMRWRTKDWFKAHPVLSEQLDINAITWQKSPTDPSLQIFTNLSKYTDLGLSPMYHASTEGGSNEEDGLVEYEVWEKPSAEYPDGLVYRMYGDGPNPIVAHLEDTEQIPGPLPYKQADGTPLWTFSHAVYEQIGGRVLGSGPIDLIVQKQDQLNQLDSMILLIIQRMSNPVWLEPKGSEVQRLTGMPGLVIKYTPSMLGGSNAKPERVAGVPVDASLFEIRKQYLMDIEELAGTYDILKGAKPAGVEAAAAMQILVERSQARFASVFQARGGVYRDWSQFALELEREFGDEQRLKQTLKPGRSWTLQAFKRSQLKGSYSVIVEDGTAAPKTTLGMRFAYDHAAGLGLVNPMDPDQNYAALQLFGLTGLSPGLDLQMQGALQKEQQFEEWIALPQNQAAIAAALQQYQTALMQYQQQIEAQQQAMQPTTTMGPDGRPATTAPKPQTPPPPPPSPLANTPLKWREWYRATVHFSEFLKWANGDNIRQLLLQPKIGPLVEALLTLHQHEIEQALQQQASLPMGGAVAVPAQAPQAQGSGRAAANSNQNAGAPGL
jgi:hypothetical protein